MSTSSRSNVQISLYVHPDTRARARAAYLATQNTADGVRTFGALIERAVLAECERLEQLHNGGQPWPPHDDPLPWPKYHRTS